MLLPSHNGFSNPRIPPLQSPIRRFNFDFHRVRSTLYNFRTIAVRHKRLHTNWIFLKYDHRAIIFPL